MMRPQPDADRLLAVPCRRDWAYDGPV